jgi:prepilin-type N-terminal cleavage/methylation domain-containing protein
MKFSGRSRRAFTLVEVLVTVTVSGLVFGAVLPFFIFNLKSQFVGEQKLQINNDIRRVTNELIENAREANNYVVYQNFYATTRYDGTAVSRDANGNGAVTFADRLLNGQSGDMLVLVYYKDQYFDARFYDGVAGNSPDVASGIVNRIVVYWIAPNRLFSGEYALYVIDSDKYKVPASATSWTTAWSATFPATLSASTTVESLLPPATAAWAQHADARIIVNDINGLSSGACFQNFHNRSVVIRAKVLHGNKAKRVTDTYNFTITPRG